AASLICATCHLFIPKDRCRLGLGVCVAQKDEKCMLLQISQSNVLLLSYMVCQKFCRNLTLKYNNRTYIHQCCQDDFCNLE
ncbi:Prostate and testis expressed protein 3, partial [Galemys pyrenaicus]